LRILDVGCGLNKRPGAIGIDFNRDTAADVLADIDRGALPFRDDSFDQAYAIHVIEHVDNVIRTMEELHRVCRPGGKIHLETPHYTDFSSFCDPTHRWHLNSSSFRYFTEDRDYSYYSRCRLRQIHSYVSLLRPWRLLGFEFLINRSRRLRLWWEYYACFIIRGKAMIFEFEVLKSS
jgi:SAM-dependent methyltransferase